MKLETNAIIGRTYSLRELRDRFDAVYLAVGAGLPVFMNVPGENFKGVYSANEYLTRVNLMGAWNAESDTPVLRGHRVVVVGGGNVAMDSVRTAQAAGRRRGHDRLPARHGGAARRGSRRSTTPSRKGSSSTSRSRPVEVLADENRWVTGIRCVRMELGEPDASGRRRPIVIEGSEFVIDCDMVVVAIGTKANPLLTASEPDLEINPWGYIVTDDFGMSSIPGVFAGGDIVRGAATVILAMGDGKRSAHAIDAFLRGEYPPKGGSRLGRAGRRGGVAAAGLSVESHTRGGRPASSAVFQSVMPTRSATRRDATFSSRISEMSRSRSVLAKACVTPGDPRLRRVTVGPGGGDEGATRARARRSRRPAGPPPRSRPRPRLCPGARPPTARARPVRIARCFDRPKPASRRARRDAGRSASTPGRRAPRPSAPRPRA